MILRIEGEFIKLGQALKASRLADYGSDAKMVIQNGEVSVNGEVDVRRGRKLVRGDVVEYNGETLEIL
ncbi:MAG: RNA-binding S4 domain-containing protein [Lachnospiraceae bacterium]|nr:RNA-binding S4 domain-containing protein [Lachnospiraceae bacterium]